jgi:hypothetical protein
MIKKWAKSKLGKIEILEFCPILLNLVLKNQAKSVKILTVTNIKKKNIFH